MSESPVDIAAARLVPVADGPHSGVARVVLDGSEVASLVLYRASGSPLSSSDCRRLLDRVAACVDNFAAPGLVTVPRPMDARGDRT